MSMKPGLFHHWESSKCRKKVDRIEKKVDKNWKKMKKLRKVQKVKVEKILESCTKLNS